MPWSSRTYLTFGNERTRPAADLLARLPDCSPEHVVDLGCGPGNSTALLCARFPNARIVGVDSSEDMLKKARSANLKATFILADLQQHVPDKPVDVLFANAVLHWIDDHAALFPKLCAQLGRGGLLAVQMPNNFAEPTHTLMRQVASMPAFQAKLDGQLQPVAVQSPRVYHRLLSPIGLVDLWETTYYHVLSGRDPVLDWVRGTTLVPVRKALSASDYATFEETYGALLREAYPQEEDGRTILPFRRIFIVVQKTT